MACLLTLFLLVDIYGAALHVRSLQDAVVLARALEFNDTLATLTFTHNPIGEVGKELL